MTVAQRLTEAEYRELALSEPDRAWELWDGVPREKPLMSIAHGDVLAYFGGQLINQLDRAEWRVRVNHGRARLNPLNFYVPDVAVVPAAAVRPHWLDPRALDAYADPLPLVVEIWSPSTGGYDVGTKLRGYQERGDREIWYLHPYEPTLTVRRRQPDGSYAETTYTGGIVPVQSLPGVAIDLDALLEP